MKVFYKRHQPLKNIHDPTPPQNQLPWSGFWGEARTRILGWYILILALAFGIAIPAFRQLMFARVDARIRTDMIGEVEDFREILVGNVNLERLENNRIRDDETDLLKDFKPSSSAEEEIVKDLRVPTNEQELMRFFEAYLRTEIPEDNTFLITFIDGEFFESSPKALPEDLKPETPLMQQLAIQSEPSQGKRDSQSQDISHIFYFVEPVKSNGQHLGTLIIAHSAEEHAEILEAVGVIVQVAVAVMFISLLVVWFAAGRILQPLQTLANTAHSISGSDLSQRIPVKGKGELANLAATFNRMMDRLESAFASQRKFVNDAGHELRTPITIIRGHLELIGDDPEEQHETIALVIDEIDRMSGFVEDLILLARTEQPKFLQLSTVDAEAITHEIFTQAKALGQRNWQLDAVAKGEIFVDRQRIVQAIMHLVNNAIQHTQLTDDIHIGSKISQDNFHLWVQDSGLGISADNQKQIFERFARVTDYRRRSEGAGLGLSVVKAIVEAHHGEVTLQSQVGIGSTFTMIVPVQGSAHHPMTPSNHHSPTSPPLL